MNTLTPKRTFSRTGFGLLLATLVSTVAGIFILLPFMKPEVLTKMLETVGSSGLFLLMYAPKFLALLVFFLIVRTIPKCDWEKQDMSLAELVRVFVMTYAVSMLLNAVGILFSKAAPAGGSQETALIGGIAGSGSVIGFLIPVLFAPVVEELIFRRLMIDRLRNYGEKTAILFTALCFGLFHGNIAQFLYATSVGVFLGNVYCRTGKLRYTLIIHILLNLFSNMIMLLLPMVGSGGRTLMVALVIAVLVIMAAMLVSGLVLFIRALKRKSFRTINAMSTAIPRGEVLSTVYLNAGVILFFAYCLFQIVTSLLNIQLQLPGIPQA